MAKQTDPSKTSRAKAFDLWMKAANPMVTFIKTIDVTNAVRYGKKKNMKFNMLMLYCVGMAAKDIDEFYLLPVGDKLMQYDTIAVNTIVKNKDGGINSCDIPFSTELDRFNSDYIKYTAASAEKCEDKDLSQDNMVIGTSAIVETELDGAVGIYSGMFNNPFIIWSRYRKKGFRCYLTLSFQFHHTQLDGSHAGRFLEDLQREIKRLK